MTALHWAASHGNRDVTRMLLYAGANTEAVTRIGDYTPLHLASKLGHASVVETLLKAGSNADGTTTAGGARPLHFAAASGSTETITLLLDHGVEVNARESAWGQTPLMFAASNNRAEAIRVLLQRGADPAITMAAFDVAAMDKTLRAGGKRRDERLAVLRSLSVEAKEQTAESEAKTAAKEAEPVETEEDEDEVIDERDPTYRGLVGHQGGLTALLLAARDGYVESAKGLLESGADIDQVSAADQTSPLLIAAINGHFDLAMLLLERGADPNLASEAGATPLYAALNVVWALKASYPQQTAFRQQKASYLELMEALLKAGADPNVRLQKHLWYMNYNFNTVVVETKGATPFWRAAYATDVDAMHLLIAHGADPNIPTRKVPRRRRGSWPKNDGEDDPSGLPPVPIGGPAAYPIHAASGVGYGESFVTPNAHRHAPDGWLPAVRYLVEELGADVNARDHNGYSPLHHAAARGDNELIRYLVAKGAEVTTLSRRGQTTADMANGPVQRIQPFPETLTLLESLGAENNQNCLSC